jgi:1,4-dihydroxy-2-naphthoate octaprenyltransferase
VRAERKLMSSSDAPIKLLKMIRVHIVVGGFLAFSLGALLAVVGGGSFDPTCFVLGYTVMLLGDLSTHYSNDYFDVEVDRCIGQKKFFAGNNILVSNPSLRSLTRIISVALLVASNLLAVGLVIFLAAPIEFFIVILDASLVGWFYSAPPLRLISRGVGEVAVACVTGFAIPALGYLAVRGRFDPLFIYLAVPFVMYGFMLSLSLGVPDVEVDRKGGKRTLAVRKGAKNVFFLILMLAVTATLTCIAYRWLITSAVMDFGIIALLSIVPLIAGLAGFVGVIRKRSVKRFSGLNIASLFAFNTLMIAYLAILLVN